MSATVSERPVSAGALPVPHPLPILRRTLRLYPGPRLRDGSPSWTLEDPARSSFYRIAWAEAEMLARWHLGNAAQVAAAVATDTTLALESEDVEAFAQFLRDIQLVELSGAPALDTLRRRHQTRRSSWAGWLLQNYLSIRLPLLRPDRFLTRTLPRVRPLLGRGFALISLGAALLGLYLVTRQWETFVHTFLHFFSPEGAMLAACTLVLTKTLHEFGHAYACKLQGCRVPTMGVAFLVLWPVLYTDASGAWRLPQRRQRLAIGGAGMLAEIYLAAWATLVWTFLPDGPLRSCAFILASTSWILTLAVNLNPLMRFDGYFLFSDLLDVPNLQQRAFDLARWRLRKTLFGLNDPAPEHFEPWLRRVLLGYAFATWVYRFFLFLGIALLVYHYAFKLLGIVLFAVEIVHFIMRPIYNELRHWYQRRKDYRMNRHTLISGALLLAAIILAVLPWRGRVEAPALLRAERQASLFVPVAARLERMDAVDGQTVQKDQTLFQLQSPQLAHDQEKLDRDIALLREQASLQRRAADDNARQAVAQQELQSALKRKDALARQSAQLQVIAPFDGRLVDLTTPLAVGEWLQAGEGLATVVAPDQPLVEAFVGERDRERLSIGANAWFYPEDPRRPSQSLTVEDIGQTAVHKLSSAPELASVYEGRIAAQLDEQHVPVPEQALYRVLLRPQANVGQGITALRGSVSIQAEARSPLAQIAREVMAVLIRESSF
ncbi:HlyD family efflux transporter periplasmic adaptor subunit [Pseudomonas sp. XS1P51]